MMSKRLYRSTHDRMISGVCAGLGEYFDMDPTIVRLIFVVTAVFSSFFPVALAYLVLAVIIPESTTENPTEMSDYEVELDFEDAEEKETV